LPARGSQGPAGRRQDREEGTKRGESRSWSSRTSRPATGANHQRVHQFSGNISERHGGYRIDIDQDYLDVQLGGGSGGGGGGGRGNGRPTRQASRAVSTTGRAVDSFFTGRDRALWSTAYQLGSLR